MSSTSIVAAASPSGSGVEPHEIKQFLGQFDQVRDLMRQMAKMSMWERIKMVTGMGKAGAFQPGAKMMKTKGDTGHRKSAEGTGERAEEEAEEKDKMVGGLVVVVGEDKRTGLFREFFTNH